VPDGTNGIYVPRLVDSPNPAYTDAVRRNRIQGLVLVGFVVRPDKGEKGNFDLIGWLAAQTGHELEIAAFTIAELWHGIERATPPQRANCERYLGTMVERLEAIAFTEATASVHARIGRNLSLPAT
jgi:hypothetical protein